jgi:hypothetical protein
VLREARFEPRQGAQLTDVITPEDQPLIDVVGWCIESFNALEAAD